MYLRDLMNKPLPQMPSEIVSALKDNKISGTQYEVKNSILLDADLQREVGYKRMNDGTRLVSMVGLGKP